MHTARLTGLVAALALLPITMAAQRAGAPPQGGGRIGGIGIGAYPQRTVEDPAAVDRGKAAYGANCAFCHGADTRGGDGGPSLLRSSVVLDDEHGEGIGPVVQKGRPDRGMPAFSMTSEQIADIAAFLHTFRVAGYDVSRDRPESIVVGDAAAGGALFRTRCASCHSPEGDLRGLASRLADPRLLQQTWLMPGSVLGRGAPPPSNPRPPRVSVTLPSGAKVEGELERLDDFTVSLRQADGQRRSFRLTDGARAEVQDPLQAHKDLLRTYTDADIHNLTAYLVTLK